NNVSLLSLLSTLPTSLPPYLPNLPNLPTSLPKIMLRQFTNHAPRPLFATNSVAAYPSFVLTNALVRPAALPFFCRHVSSLQTKQGEEQSKTFRQSYDYGVVDGYVPPEPANNPSFFEFRKWRLVKYRNMRNDINNLMHMGILKYNSKYENWNSKEFLKTAQNLYEDMNDAFARGDRTSLKEVTLDALYANLKNQLKDRKASAIWEWRCIGFVEPPRIVFGIRLRANHRTAAFETGTIGCGGGGDVEAVFIGHDADSLYLTVPSRQTIAVYNDNGKLIQGDRDKVKNVLEFVVFQRILASKTDQWRIYGKVPETQQSFEKVPMKVPLTRVWKRFKKQIKRLIGIWK
ncbi:Tim44-like domain-containing protein, partial [Jimgerdemannia flammicorona]